MSKDMQSGTQTETDDLLSVAPGIGDALQLQEVDEPMRRFHVSLIGFLNKKSVLVSHPEKNGALLQVREGQKFLVRGFSNRKTYEFGAGVIGVCMTPYPCLHLTFPAQIGVINMRAALRIRPRLACSVEFGASSLKMPALIEDISTSGARIQSKKEFGKAGDKIGVGFHVTVDGEDVLLSLPAIIRNVQHETVAADGSKVVQHGVQFVQSEGKVRMALQGFIYRTMAEV